MINFVYVKIYLIIYLLFALSPVFAQQYNFKTYSVEEGLPRSSTYALYQDSEGFIWVGLEGGGVAIFDGYNFDKIDMRDGLPSQNVRAIYKDSRGTFWFGTTEGLCRYNFDTLEVFTIQNGLVDNYIRSISEDREGNIWIGTNNGLSIYNGKIFKNLLAPEDILHNKIRVIERAHDGKMWVGSDNGINVYFDTSNPELKSDIFIVPNTVLELYEDESYSMWAGTKSGAFKFARNDTAFYDASDGLISNRIRAICQDQFGNMWFGTREGVTRFDGKQMVSFTEANGLGHNRIRDILRDDQGNLWFATYFGGLSKFSGSDFVHFTAREGLLSEQVFAITEDQNGDIILGSFDGASRLKFTNGILDTVINLTTQQGLSGERIKAIHKDKNNYVWYGTDFGITISKNNKFWHIGPEDGLPSNEILVIDETEDNNFWIGTKNGLCHIKFQSPENYTIIDFPVIEQKYKGSEITALTHDNAQNIWFGYRNGVLLCLTHEAKFIEPRTDHDISHIVSLYYDNNGQLWVGTDSKGLFRIDLTEAHPEDKLTSQQYTQADGLNSDHIYAVSFDQEEYAWIGSENGLDKIHFNTEHSITKIKHFGVKDGLHGLEIHENAMYEDSKGNLWFGTVKGAAYYDPYLEIKNPKRPILHFTDVYVGKSHNKEFNEKNRFGIPEDLVLPYDKNTIEIKFVGINLTSPEGTKYKWFLEGFDDKWSVPSSRRSVKYTNLQPGNYTLKVMAANENGLWTTTPINFSFKILKPFWQEWWFITLMCFVVIGILFGFSYLRNRKLRKAKIQLERKIALATEELRKEKSIIEEQNKEIEEQRDKLNEINVSITDSINYAKRIQKAIMLPDIESSSPLHNKIFVFYLPKDIVSGDFYWLKDKQNVSYVAAADCTGHGVPGAFMSMIGITYLDQIINTRGYDHPHKILNKLRSNIVYSLTADGEDKTNDGMDISFVKINWSTKEMEFAGANNPLYIVRDQELTSLPADKMPVGDHDLKNTSFSLIDHQLKEGDMLYMFSDGYADQFGGEKGKKFLYKRFKQTLIDIAHLPIDEQHNILKKKFFDWMGDHEQIDDILVVGIRI